MPLYLDEIWVNMNSSESAKQALMIFQALGSGSVGYPEGVTLKAGPWFSNEEAKLILVLDIADHRKTFVALGRGMAQGWILRRRLTPIVDASGVEELQTALA